MNNNDVVTVKGVDPLMKEQIETEAVKIWIKSGENIYIHITKLLV